MKLTSSQQIYWEQETGNCKDPIAAEDASDVEELLRFSVFYVHCFQGPHVLFALEKLLKIVIAIKIEALIDKLRYAIRVLTQNILNQWAYLSVVTEH